MDVDGRVERRQPEGDVRDSRDGCTDQHSWGTNRWGGCYYWDRCRRKFLALWWARHRLNGDRSPPQRPVEVQRGPMDVDGWVEPCQPEGDVRNSGDGCRWQCSRGAALSYDLDRCRRKLMALRWGRV